MTVGIVGLGNMGRALASNLVDADLGVVGYDRAGTAERLPAGAVAAESVAALAGAAPIVVLSLPGGAACRDALDGLLAAPGGVVEQIVDTSTVGVEAARALADRAADAGVSYVDAPVSGGVAGAQQRTITVMVAGTDGAVSAVEPVLDALSQRVVRVGRHAGLAQAVKLANNFLSATAMAATSEALAFGRRHGVDPTTLLEVVNSSSGRSTASAERFPRHVLTERYDAGFRGALMDKDLGLYAEAATAAGVGRPVSGPVAELWHRFADAEPDADYTRIAAFVERLADT